MDLDASHIGFVIAAYVISAAVLTGLVANTILSLKARQRDLSALEKREAPRRKARR
jgi:heme exporter protein CcmD